MKNLKKLALGLLVGAMAIGFSAFANGTSTDSGNLAGTYRLKASYLPQNWNGAVDQDITHYELAPPTYNCQESEKICTYSINDDEAVTQLAQGTFQ